MIRVRLLVAVVVLLVTGSTVRAQPPISRYVAERARAEVEVAGEMARLKALLERVTNERDAARAKLKEQGK